MSQVEIKKDIYFQQVTEDVVDGVYCNALFIQLRVDRMLSEKELKALGEKCIVFCESTPFINNVITNFKERYKENPNWDLEDTSKSSTSLEAMISEANSSLLKNSDTIEKEGRKDICR